MLEGRIKYWRGDEILQQQLIKLYKIVKDEIYWVSDKSSI